MKRPLIYIGIDSWNRPVFKDLFRKEYFGSTDRLYDYDITAEKVLKDITEKDLTYFGNSFGCEPMGTGPGQIEILKTFFVRRDYDN